MDFDDFSFPSNRVQQSNIGGANVGSAWSTNLELFLSQTPIASGARMIKRELEGAGQNISKEDALKELSDIPGGAEAAISRNLVTDKGIDRNSLDRIKHEATLFHARSISASNASNGFARSSQALAAGLVAEAVDPLNLLIGAGIGSVMKGGKVALAATRIGRIRQAARAGAIEGAIGEIAVIPLRVEGAQYGDTYDFSQTAADITFGALFGAAIRGAGRTVYELKDGARLNELLAAREMPEEAVSSFRKEAGVNQLPQLQKASELIADLDPEIRDSLTRTIIGQAAAGKKDLEIDALISSLIVKGVEEKRAKAIASGLETNYRAFFDDPAVARAIDSAKRQVANDIDVYRKEMNEELAANSVRVNEWVGKEAERITDDLIESDGVLGAATAESRIETLENLIADMQRAGIESRTDLLDELDAAKQLVNEEMARRVEIEGDEVPAPTKEDLAASLELMTGKSGKIINQYAEQLQELNEQISSRVDYEVRALSSDQLRDLYGEKRMESADFHTWFEGSEDLAADAMRSPSAEFKNGIMTDESMNKLEVEAENTAFIETISAELEAVSPGLSQKIIDENNIASNRISEGQDRVIDAFIDCKLGVAGG